MNKHYPKNMNVIDQIDACIDLLCETHGSCKVSEVLVTLGYKSTPEMLAIVLHRAECRGYRIEKQSKGYRIHDW